MLTAARSLARASETGRPLPEVPALDELYHGYFKCRPRKGQVMMIAGQPGSQKSAFALWWSAMMGLPTLYMSADMAPHTAVTRLGAIVTGDTVEDVAEGVAGAGEGYYGEALDKSQVRFCFDPNPTLDSIYSELDAWVEGSDTYPDVIVIDNLMDVLAGGGESEFQVYKQVLLETKTLARETGAAVIVLHHMSEASGDPERPASRKWVQGKVGQSPELILSIALVESTGEFKVSVVKNRNGKSDPGAKVSVSFRSHPELNVFEKWFPEASASRTDWYND